MHKPRRGARGSPHPRRGAAVTPGRRRRGSPCAPSRPRPRGAGRRAARRPPLPRRGLVQTLPRALVGVVAEDANELGVGAQHAPLAVPQDDGFRRGLKEPLQQRAAQRQLLRGKAGIGVRGRTDRARERDDLPSRGRCRWRAPGLCWRGRHTSETVSAAGRSLFGARCVPHQGAAMRRAEFVRVQRGEPSRVLLPGGATPLPVWNEQCWLSTAHQEVLLAATWQSMTRTRSASPARRAAGRAWRCGPGVPRAVR